ncbi:MAG: hypothetical protein KIH64_014765, partial [Mycobacterium sp.]|nr:hypothetical protein [Mycobacterium sp.]
QATHQATHQATRQATYQATDQATYQATHQATYQATDQATDQATHQATRQATDQSQAARFASLARDLGAEFGVDHIFMLRCAQHWYPMYQGGNMWSYWDCYLTAFRDVLGLVLPEHDKYKAWEACAIEGGFRLVHEEFCIVSDRPEVLKVDAQNRPHCADGPSHRWRDGWSQYHWHGMRIPEDREYIIHSPERITVQAIDAERNAEIRRVMIDRYGPARYVTDSGAIVVHEMPADHKLTGLRTARLLRKDVPDDEPIIYVDVLNSTPEPDGTVKRYMLRVDPNAYSGEASRNCHAAAASTWRNADGSLAYKRWQDYKPAAES